MFHGRSINVYFENECQPSLSKDSILPLKAGRNDAAEGFGIMSSSVSPVDLEQTTGGREKTTP